MDNEFASIETEMKRGFLQLLVLVVLEKEAYGYAMVRAFRELGYEVEENTLYPLLRRLEKRGLVEGKWEVGEERPRKFYAVTQAGRDLRRELLAIWDRQDEIIRKTVKESKNA
ncbi:MAG TPA: PadR family transcriptional regulator [Candidatus Aminicenantes bacterium]|nr:PadR family transcriptional regulator [Candidatus Aminicenantes bacterium]